MPHDNNKEHPPPSSGGPTSPVPSLKADIPDQANGYQELYSSMRSNKSNKSKTSIYDRNHEKIHPDGMSTLVELLTETSQASTHDILNDGEEDQMFITGYEKSPVKSFFCYFGFFLTLGIMRLVMHWWQHWLLLATHRKCSLEVAQKVLVHERYQGKHDAFYVKNVINMDSESIMEIASNSKRLSPNGQNVVKELEHIGITDGVQFIQQITPFQVAFHQSGGKFDHYNEIRFFSCKKLRYIWNKDSKRFVKLTGLDVRVPSVTIHHTKGLSVYEQNIRRLVYGTNEILIPLKGVFTLLFLEVLNPFYVFQIFSVMLWFVYDYYYYATVIILMSGFGITASILQTQKNQKALYSTVKNSDTAMVVRDNCESEQIETRFLVSPAMWWKFRPLGVRCSVTLC